MQSIRRSKVQVRVRLLVTALALAGCAENGTVATDKAADGDTPQGARQIDASADEGGKGESGVSGADISGGASVRLADRQAYDAVIAAHRGKVVLVDFWATWCIPCVQQFPHTVDVARKYAGQDVAIVSFSMDEPDSQSAVVEFLTRHEANFDNLLSQTGASDEAFEALEIAGGALPHYKLYDRTGQLRHTFGVDPSADKQFTLEDIDRSLQALLDE